MDVHENQKKLLGYPNTAGTVNILSKELPPPNMESVTMNITGRMKPDHYVP